MKYPNDFINKIICGDCNNILPQIPDNSIDLIIADPPYNIDIHKWDKINNYVKWSKNWLRLCYNKLNKNGSLFLYGLASKNLDFLELILFCKKELQFNMVNWIIWCKSAAMTTVKNKFVPRHEDLIWFSKEKYKYNIQRIYPRSNEGYERFKHCDKNNDGIIKLIDFKIAKENYFYKIRKSRGAKDGDIILDFNKPTNLCLDWWDDISNLHKKQGGFKKKNLALKPEKLSERIIKASTDEEAIVLIPFAGLGSEIISANRLNRKFIGIEINSEYCKIARKRIINT